MLHYQLLSYFENPARRMYLETPRWTDPSSGKSTEHAKEYAKNTATERANLAADVASAIPGRTALKLDAYTAKTGDSVTKVLLEKLPAAKLNNSKLMLLAYRYMLKQSVDINSLFPGDKMEVVNGKLTITRAPGSKFTNLSVDIFPYLDTPAAAPATGGTAPVKAPSAAPAQGGTAPGGAPAGQPPVRGATPSGTPPAEPPVRGAPSTAPSTGGTAPGGAPGGTPAGQPPVRGATPSGTPPAEPPVRGAPSTAPSTGGTAPGGAPGGTPQKTYPEPPVRGAH